MDQIDSAPDPVYKAVERILDEESAWIARPSKEVTRRVAFAATLAAQVILEKMANAPTPQGEVEKLVERLRCPVWAGAADGQIMCEAADIIQRLSAERDKFRKFYEEACNNLDIHRAQIDRLLEALECAEADMRRYANDPTPHRMLVSADGVRDSIAQEQG